MKRLIQVHENDNVAVALDEICAGYEENGLTVLEDIPFGHKVLLCDLKANDCVIKYGNPIGHVVCNVQKGQHIHSHNLVTNLSDVMEYQYRGGAPYVSSDSKFTFQGYRREDGRAATRNEIWIIPTVGCVNKTAERLAELGNQIAGAACDGVFAYTHPYGCSQLSGDLENTQKILSGLVRHPNAGGVLVVSLGCENNYLGEFKKYLSGTDEKRIRFLVTQDCRDELAEGERLIRELSAQLQNEKRVPISVSELIVGYKCGGSDAFSGITANPLCGRLTDRLTAMGVSAILTEVPEMFGAEHLLMKRAESRCVFDQTVHMINGFKQYYIGHGQPVYENPSPGNMAGGITTLEEKSLGCIQKGGNAPVTGVLAYGEPCEKPGLNLLTGPGNDIVSTTNLTASGAHIILFTTGRGTPLGAPVPTVKIASNSRLARRKENWIDFNAGEILDDSDFDEAADRLFHLILRIASGEKTKNEYNAYREIAILKDGVTL